MESRWPEKPTLDYLCYNPPVGKGSDTSLRMGEVLCK